MTDNAKILIVEDQAEVAAVMVYLLTCAGFETEVATTGEAAMQMALTGDFDLITLDVDLPDTNGFEICRRLKKNTLSCDTPVLFVSGRPCEQDVQRGLELGAVDYIAKPFGMEFASRLLSHIKAKNNSTGPANNVNA